VSSLLQEIFVCLFVAGLVGLVIGYFIGQLKYKEKLNSLKNEFKLKINKNNDTWETKIEKLSLEHRVKLNEEKNNMEIEKKKIKDRIKKLLEENQRKNIEIENIKNRLLIAKDETKKVEKKLKDEYQEEMKKHKSRVSNLLNRVDIRYNKGLNDLIESLVTLEGNAIKEEAELRYRLKDTKQRLENKISNLQKEVEDLKKRVHNLINAKKININIG
jgi:regulator of replication initiation timing